MRKGFIFLSLLLYFGLATFFIVTNFPKEDGSQDSDQKEIFKVIRVLDGDTIELEGGVRVRYIGIDTPEIDTNQCYATQAAERNEQLVLGKEVRLEKDVSETDDYYRFLRYVYVSDVFVNELLVEEGYARSVPIMPDIKYQERFYNAQEKAKGKMVGLWSECY